MFSESEFIKPKEKREAVSEEMLQKLSSIFEGKEVRVTNTGNPSLRDFEGVCKTFHITESGADMELTNGVRIGFYPEIVTDNAVEGDMGKIAGRRKIQLSE